jgi:hypothetical protein
MVARCHAGWVGRWLASPSLKPSLHRRFPRNVRCELSMTIECSTLLARRNHAWFRCCCTHCATSFASQYCIYTLSARRAQFDAKAIARSSSYCRWSTGRESIADARPFGSAFNAGSYRGSPSPRIGASNQTALLSSDYSKPDLNRLSPKRYSLHAEISLVLPSSSIASAVMPLPINGGPNRN